jgi:hypothetical protein
MGEHNINVHFIGLGATLEPAGPVSRKIAVRRPTSSPPELIDEYHWVTITNGCVPPSVAELRQSLRLAMTRATPLPEPSNPG